MRPENLVNAISQKPMKGILPSFSHRCTLVHRCGTKSSKVEVTVGEGITVDAARRFHPVFSFLVMCGID